MNRAVESWVDDELTGCSFADDRLIKRLTLRSLCSIDS